MHHGSRPEETPAYVIRPVAVDDGPQVIAVFNHYITRSLAAYHDRAVGPDFLQRLRRGALDYSFQVAETGGQVIGFGFLYPFHPADTLRRSATLTYFILPEHTGRGLGSLLLKHLTEDARQLGIDTLLAHISSANEGSLRFHLRHGFRKCGHFERVGRKWNRDFDVIWVQKFLGED
jgi:L-amino acid N-acyltransferase YncA